MGVTQFQRGDAPKYRVLPHNNDAEQGLLAALMIDPRVMDRVGEIVTEDDFFMPAHVRIFKAIRIMIEGGGSPSPVTLKNQFEYDDDLRAVGGAAYLADLCASIVSAINAESYARTVRDLAVRRRLITIAEETVEDGYDFSPEARVESVLEAAEEKLFALGETGQTSAPVMLSTAVGDTMCLIESLQRGDKTGIRSGIGGLDDINSGFWPGHLIVLAGRPSMGKTALAMSIAHNMAADQRKILFFSMEMSRDELIQRLIARHTGIPSGMQMRKGALTPEHWKALTQASGRLSRLPLSIDDAAGLNVHQIRTRARRYKRQNGLDAIFIDYLGLMAMASGYSGLVDQLGEATRALKVMAKDLGIPVILLHQINRGVEGKDDKRPSMADLRDSGKIEEHADVIMLLYRDEYYLENHAPKRSSNDSEERFDEKKRQHLAQIDKARGKADIIIDKFRNGRRGTVTVQFNPVKQWFYDHDMGELE